MVKRRKSSVQPPPGACPLRQCVKLLSGAWTADVIWYLGEGERCFTELEHDLRGVSAKMLSARLRKLQRDGIVVRAKRATSPPTVWYALSPLGQELAQALTVIVGIGHRLKQARDQ
jgi:DNA-binding HxlR family transcriptional regulator